ncbi:MAG: hypothetical protein HY934_05285, partial [Candidatus Firestonebacteria bacterium]|nr:hypothetical protein [Candidatus Firestonebacteria bacterium]
MPTKRISYLFIFIFILSILHTKSYSKDDKKEPPPIKLPGVTITGEEKDVQIQHGEKLQIIEEELYDSAKPIPLGKEEKETVFNSPDYKKAFIVEVKEKDKRFMLNISLEGGNYNYYSAEIIHGGQNDNNNYLLDYYYVHDGGERERSLQDKNKIVFDISQKLADEYQVINISGKIVSSLIELPGQLDNPFTNRSRKMEDVFVSGCWEKRKAQDEYLKIGYFWKSQKLEEQDSTTAVPGPGDRSGMGIECNYAFIYENPVRFNLKYSSNEALNKSSANLQQAGLEMDILKLIE